MVNTKFLSVGTLLMLSCTYSGAVGQGHGDDCSVKQPCSGEFTCINQRCQCHFPDHQTYDRTIGKCVSLLLGPCVAKVNGITWEYPCVASTECKNTTSSGLAECACQDGYTRYERQCKAQFGGLCKYSSDCIGTGSSFDNNLVCKNETCDCPNLQEFDETTGKCRGLAGGKCSRSTSQACVEGAVCEMYSSFDGICRCTGEYVASSERRCVSHHRCSNTSNL